jgi:hypothetical protein
MPKKKKARKPKITNLELGARILAVFLIIGACTTLLIWASRTEDSELAKSIREVFGLSEPVTPEPAVTPPPTPPPAPKVSEEAPPPPEPVVSPPQKIDITLAEMQQSPDLWPQTLNLTISRTVPIRCNGNEYGSLEFTPDMRLTVTSLEANGEVNGISNGNNISVHVQQTNLSEWFESAHGERFKLEPLPSQPEEAGADAGPRVGTPEGETAFWTDFQIWCKRNYDSISVEVAQNTLIFRWFQRADIETNYAAEARLIAEQYLKLRKEYGSDENYAPCEIRHPETDELLGSSSIFMPQL